MEFNPIPAGPPCSFFYITQKVWVWDCRNFLTFLTFLTKFPGHSPPIIRSKTGLLYFNCLSPQVHTGLKQTKSLFSPTLNCQILITFRFLKSPWEGNWFHKFCIKKYLQIICTFLVFLNFTDPSDYLKFCNLFCIFSK